MERNHVRPVGISGGAFPAPVPVHAAELSEEQWATFDESNAKQMADRIKASTICQHSRQTIPLHEEECSASVLTASEISRAFEAGKAAGRPPQQ